MRTIKTYSKGASFYNAFLRTWPKIAMRLPAPLHTLLPCRNFLFQLFKPVQRDVAMQLEVLGFKHHAHPAATELRCDEIVQDCLADHFACVVVVG